MGVLDQLAIPRYGSRLITVGGIRTEMRFPAMVLAVQASVAVKDQAYAANMFLFFCAFGQKLSVAIGSAIFQNQRTKKMPSYPFLVDMAGEYSKDAGGLVHMIKEMLAGVKKE
jgi:hypothetical protein